MAKSQYSGQAPLPKPFLQHNRRSVPVASARPPSVIVARRVHLT